MRRYRLSLLVLLVAAALAAPAGAAAGTASLKFERGESPERDGTTKVVEITYRAAAGEANAVRAWVKGNSAVLTDRAGIVPGRGCRRLRRRAVSCPLRGAEDKGLSILLGDRADSAVLAGGTGAGVLMDGGAGADRLDAGVSDAALDGGPGDDRMRSRLAASFDGGPGDDHMVGGPLHDSFVQGSEPDGSDVMIGNGQQKGDGARDLVSYDERTEGMQVDFQGDPDDGAPGEGDRVGRDIEVVRGGKGADRITGNGDRNYIDGDRGADTLAGGGGNDELVGGPDRDTASDRLLGDAGDDKIDGTAGPDQIDGGPGRDTVSGKEGNDKVDTRDEHADIVHCGTGRDEAMLDGLDSYANEPPDQVEGFPPPEGEPDNCETVQRDSPPAAVVSGEPALGRSNLPVVYLGPGQPIATLGVSCPGDFAATCKGFVRVVGPGISTRRRPFSVRAGRFGSFEVPVGREALRRAKRGELVRATLVLTTRRPDGTPVRRELRVRIDEAD